MIASAEEVLVELLDELEELCGWSRYAERDYLDDTPGGASVFRRCVLEAAVTAKTRLEKVRLGVVAA